MGHPPENQGGFEIAMTAKTGTPRATSEDIRMVLRLAELAVFDPRVKQTLREASEEIVKLDSELAALRERLSESQHNWQVLNLQILAELRPPTVTEQSIPERVKAMRERLKRAEKDAERYRALRSGGVRIRWMPASGDELDTLIDDALGSEHDKSD